jgi:hypothetical protein
MREQIAYRFHAGSSPPNWVGQKIAKSRGSRTPGVSVVAEQLEAIICVHAQETAPTTFKFRARAVIHSQNPRAVLGALGFRASAGSL